MAGAETQAGDGDSTDPDRPAKSRSAFRTISEVAGELNVPQHVLRFWETRFSQLRPLKRAGGRRYYRPEDVVLLHRIRVLLYQNGYTIKGVQKLLREAHRGGNAVLSEDAPSAAPEAPATDNGDRAALRAILDDLVVARDLLRRR